jgi:hypothetical protein
MLRILAREKKAVFGDGLSLLLIAAGLYLFFASIANGPGFARTVAHPQSPGSRLDGLAAAFDALSRPPPSAGVTGAGTVTYATAGQEWDAASRVNVDRAFALLPPRIAAELGNSALGPLKVLVNRSGRTLSGAQPYGGAANFYSTNEGDNEVILYPDQSTLTTLHELGHAFNLRHEPPGRYALVVLEPEMESFMAATGWRLLSSNEEVQRARDQVSLSFAYDGKFAWPHLSHDDPLEDFANSFALYFYDPDGLRTQSPERFDWFAANVGR